MDNLQDIPTVDRVLADLLDEAPSGAPRTKSAGGSAGAPSTLDAIAANLDRQTAAIETIATKASRTAATPPPSSVRAPARVVEPAPGERERSAWEQFKALNDRRLKEARRGRVDVVTSEHLDRINAAMDRAGDQAKSTEIARLKRQVLELKTKLGRPGHIAGIGHNGGPSMKEAAFHKYREAIVHHLKTGETNFGGESLLALQQKALQVGSQPDGGFLVQSERDNSSIDRILSQISPMRSLAQVLPISSASYKRVFNKGGMNSGWVGETDTRTETTTPSLEEQDFPAMELYAEPAATQSMLEDASIDVEAWLDEEVQIKFAEDEGTAFIGGNGVKKPWGILAMSKVANASWAWGKVGYLHTGVSAGFHATNPGDIFHDVPYSLKQGHRAAATWLMNRTSIAGVRKIKETTTGQYLWQPGLKDGEPPTLNGYRVNEDEQMPDISADSYSIAFGDWYKSYLIVDRLGMSVLRDPYTNKPYVLFYTRKRVGGGVKNFETYKLIKFGTS